jgi:hypothetical protein
MKNAGYPELTPNQLVEFKIFNIDKAFIRKATEFSGSKPTPQKIIQLKIAEGNGTSDNN